ncbi:MAG: hypothetical protein PHQ86_05605 [Dehalococcoidales bacterium]|nr:hypothetical protein [Dehalococcoidales bacterium]
MNKIKTALLKIVGGIKDNMSAFLTAIGSALIPLSIVLAIEIPGAFSFSSVWGWIALALMIIGIAIIYRAWKTTTEEEKQRRKESITNIALITGIADKLVVNINEVIKTLEKKL